MSDPVVLVVDDEPNVVRLCRRLLERDHFTVLAATSPSQALAILSRQPVDLLLADIRMPGLGGFELLSLARRHQPDLAAVIMTGYGTLDTAMEALHRGADGLILKPFTGSDLVENVQRALHESQQKRDSLRLRALRPLFDVTPALFAETDPQALKELILETLADRLEASGAVLRERNESGQAEIVSRGLNEASDFWRLDWLVEQEPQAGAVWINRDAPPGAPEMQAQLAEQGAVALIAGGVHLGEISLWLAVARLGQGDLFREADVEMFGILANQSAAALENARLYAELRAYIRQVEASQQALVQAEKMAAAGRLTASIAHEINNPLQSLHNCLHLAGRKELNPADRERFLGMAQNELERLMSTVQRMLDFYRPGAKDRNPTDINGLVRRVVALLEPQLKQNGIKVDLRLQENLPGVMAVAGQLQQVLINLILNAMEAMPDGGRVLFSTAWDGGGEKRLPGVVILVEDSGPGVPYADRTRVFEPFVSTKENGTGLGLSVSYGIISAHGGSLALVDGQGQGACFEIRLPEGETG